MTHPLQVSHLAASALLPPKMQHPPIPFRQRRWCHNLLLPASRMTLRKTRFPNPVNPQKFLHPGPKSKPAPLRRCRKPRVLLASNRFTPHQHRRFLSPHPFRATRLPPILSPRPFRRPPPILQRVLPLPRARAQRLTKPRRPHPLRPFSLPQRPRRHHLPLPARSKIKLAPTANWNCARFLALIAK